MGETTTLAEFIVRTDLTDVPEDAIEAGKAAVRDYLGVALFGSQHEVGRRIREYVDSTVPGGDATLLGGGTASLVGAAVANGTFGHAIDYDDTFESIVIHPTSPVFAATLAAAEDVDATGAEALTGYLVGVETAFRVGHATYPSHYDNGWHSTGTVGSFGAAAATASVRGLSSAETKHALGIVASCSSSLKKNFGSMTKPLHAGHAAGVGLRATLLAERGFTADDAVLEGDLGYGNVMTPSGEYDPAHIVDGLGEEWAVEDVGFKPYPSGVITHAAMDALRTLVLEHEFEPDEVEEITVTLDDAASEMLIHERPADALQAKFSIEFCLAAVLREANPGVHEFSDEYVSDPAVRESMALVERDFEPNLFGESYANYGARVVVETGDGTELVAEERHAPGTPTNPVSEARLRDKYQECATAVLSASAADSVAAAVDGLEADGALADLVTVAGRKTDESSGSADGYVHRSLADLETNAEKPGTRWEVSPQLGLSAYNFNVAVLEPGERLSQNAYHHHDRQREFYYVVSGRCRVEVADGHFDLDTDDVTVFDPGIDHLLHNPSDEPCKLVAVGSPPEGRYPVEQVQSYEELMAERYEGSETEGGEE